MSKSNQIIAGIMVIILTLGGLYFWYRTTIPSQSEIDSAAKKIEKIEANILQSQFVEKISAKDINGPVPVEVKPEDIGREDPFSNY